jgi:hypothetical protein
VTVFTSRHIAYPHNNSVVILGREIRPRILIFALQNASPTLCCMGGWILMVVYGEIEETRAG